MYRTRSVGVPSPTVIEANCLESERKRSVTEQLALI